MTMDAAIVLDVWELMTDFVPSSKKEDTAIKFMLLFENYGFDKRDFETIRGEDTHIDAAMDNIYSDDVEEDDGYEEY